MRTAFLFAFLFAGAAHAECPAKPAPPPQDQAWAVLRDGVWDTEVPGWVAAPEPTCWVLGRVPLRYPEHSVPELPVKAEPYPWIEGLDYPAGTTCPKEAVAVGCITIPWVIAP